MDTLRLLTRSSRMNLGTRSNTSHTNQALPSAGGETQQDGSTGKKRKWDEVDDTPIGSDLPESGIRQLQNQHKIKITDLHKLHRPSKNESRKHQKEASRLFPQPLQNFKQLKTLGSNNALISNIFQQAFREPTEVQMATIPLLFQQDHKEPDLLTVAPTGSGKTLAFMIPLISKLVRQHQKAETDERHVSAIILAPTKELVGQIVNEGRKLSTNTGVKISEMRKGMKLHDQTVSTELESDDSDENDSDDDVDGDDDRADDTKNPRGKPHGPLVKSDIIVSTPLSLVNALKTNNSDQLVPISTVQTLILDEADILLDPLFRDQTLSVWDACTAANLRVSLWSATIGASIEELAISKINAHHEARGHQTPNQPLIRTIIGLKDTSLATISHRLTYASTEAGKLMGLRQLIHPTQSNARAPSNQATSTSATSSDTPLRPPFLIFTQTITRAQSLHDELQYDIPLSADGNSRIAVLHSSLTTKQRSNTMSAFRQGRIWILITTDLLSRGVDFKGVNGIVNYDIPTTAASYVHRAGRTGRAGRQGGIAVTFYTRDDVKYLKPIANIISASESTSDRRPGLPSWLIPALPELTKSSRKDIKERGVEERRALKKSDEDKERKKKLKNRIGTRSGYERKLEDKKRGMIQGSKRRARNENAQRARRSEDKTGHDDFDGFGD